MTASIDITAIVPQKWKTIIGTVGTLLSFVIPYVLSAEQYLPSPWPVVIGVVIWLLTTFGIYKAPYKPEGTVLAVNPDAEKVSSSVPASAPVAQAPNQISIQQYGQAEYPDPFKQQ